ncbi:hypothetical protein [Streptomyces sp. NPDC048659]|uniref:hypothetical protein n=1 Tax=Streptomyces sp. NPDC048659 TaxID=3155489 RepID=UPI003443175B
MTRRTILLTTGVLLALGGLAAFLTLQGLEDADRWSSVLSLFFTVAGFLLTAGGLFAARPAQSADRATAGGSIHQIKGVAGDVTIGTAPATAPPSAATPAAGTGTADQSAVGASTGGDLTQIEGVGGSVRITPVTHAAPDSTP